MRNIFINKRTRETIADYALAIAIGLALAIGALAYFDVLVK